MSKLANMFAVLNLDADDDREEVEEQTSTKKEAAAAAATTNKLGTPFFPLLPGWNGAPISASDEMNFNFFGGAMCVDYLPVLHFLHC